jgi:hypothetical protein
MKRKEATIMTTSPASHLQNRRTSTKARALSEALYLQEVIIVGVSIAQSTTTIPHLQSKSIHQVPEALGHNREELVI